MRIGYLLDLHKGGYDQPMPTPEDAHDTMEQMVLEGITAERAGFHSIQVPDRHGRTECYFPGPEQILTILARETERVAIGTFTFVATLFHPMKAAEEFAVIDNLSKGRLYTTMSRGYHPGYWQQFGIPQEHLLGRFQEAIKIWLAAFKGERFDFPGKYWQVEQGLLAPQPYQEGGWPIWGGGHAALPAIRRSAEYGECMTVDDFPIDPGMWKERTASYAEHAADFGKEPFIVLMRNGWVADSFEASAEEWGKYAADELRFYLGQGIFNNPQYPTAESITPESIAAHQVVGSAQQCIEALERYHEDFGVDYFTIRFRFPEGPPMDQALEQIQRFGEEVVAPIHKKYPAPDHPAIPAACRW